MAQITMQHLFRYGTDVIPRLDLDIRVMIGHVRHYTRRIMKLEGKLYLLEMVEGKVLTLEEIGVVKND